MLSKNVLIIAATALLMIASSDIAQLVGSPSTSPADDADKIARQEASLQQQMQKARLKILAQLKTDLGSSDEEFAVLQPLIEKCLDTRDVARQSVNIGNFGVARTFSTGTHGPQSIKPTPGPTPASRALQDLDVLLHDPNATQAAIQAQMQVVRQEVKQANDDYTAACKALRDLVTGRQEVALFLDDVLN